MKKSVSVKAKLVMLLILIIIVIGCILFVSSYRNISTFTRQSQNTAETALNKLLSTMEKQMDSIEATSSFICEDEMVHAYFKDPGSMAERIKLEGHLKKLVGQHNSIPLYVYVIGLGGEYLTTYVGYRRATDEGIEKMGQSDWYRQQDIWSDKLKCAGVFPAYIEDTGSSYHCIFVRNVFNSLGERLGVVVIDIDSYLINRQLASITNQGDVSFLICSGVGVIANSASSTALYNSEIGNESGIVRVALRDSRLTLAYETNEAVMSGFQRNAWMPLFLTIGILIAAGLFVFFYLNSIKETERELSSLEFRMLQSQINPHFLYNTLNNLRVMADIIGVANLSSAISSLSNLLRYSIGERENRVTIQEEIKYIRDYIYLNNIRFNDKYILNVDVDAALENVKVLKFLIQPFVENAIIHGYGETKGVGQIDLAISLDGGNKDMLRIEVRDYGKGFSLPDLAERKKRIHGIGISNVEERLKLIYGDRYNLKVDSVVQTGTHVVICVPRDSGEEPNDRPNFR